MRWSCPVADGGEGTAEVLASARRGRWRERRVTGPLGRPVRARWLLLPDGTAVVESAEAIGLAARRASSTRSSRRAPGSASSCSPRSRPRPASVLVCLGGSATVDGGAGLLSVRRAGLRGRAAARRVRRAEPAARRARRRARVRAAEGRVTGGGRGARAAARGDAGARALRDLPGAGAAGGLGAALASLGGELVEGAELVLDQIRFDEHARAPPSSSSPARAGGRDDVRGQGARRGRPPLRGRGVRCVLFGGRLFERPDGVEIYELPSGPGRAAEDLIELGRKLGWPGARRRVAASPSPGGASRRGWRSPRPSAGTPRR